MVWFNVFCVFEIIALVTVALMIAKEDALIAFEQRVISAIRRFRHRRQAVSLEKIGLTVYPAPSMTAEEVVRVVRDFK